MSVTIEISGLQELQSLFERGPEAAEIAERLAVNDTIDWARRQASKRIRGEIAFRARYLGNGDDDGALSVPKKSRGSGDYAVLRARNDARSLASFATPRFGPGKRNPKLRVGTGRSTNIERGFGVRLRRGNADIDSENYNLGLAIRLKPGERVQNKTRMRAFGTSGLYLLYGPSVAQVFDDVAIEMRDEVANYLADQFVRQFVRLTRG
ncbi:MAG: hypothetical protein DDT26_00291 [Dehalococcoidia bacterium]|nr:hypothetical protein [Chloroflexota bacterium]